jgi:putative restriction endonuclease
MEDEVNVVYLFGVASGLYSVEGAGIVEDLPGELTFKLILLPIDSVVLGMFASLSDLGVASRRHHVALVQRRVGQARFRSVVMSAYRTQCAVCRLRRNELLDAAHILPDYAGGPLVVTNGLALCKIHHAAYDSNLLGIRPDYVAEVRSDLLSEEDGPMLLHGIQGVHDTAIVVPTVAAQRPDVGALERRYEQFRVA